MLFYWALICSILLTFYFTQFLRALWAWVRISQAPKAIDTTINFSIVVAVRNEEKNIEKLLANLLAIDYPSTRFEILLVDDFSDDHTADIIRKFQERHEQIRLISLGQLGLKHNQAFKKTAIKLGVQHAQYDWIVTTDADCELNPDYLGVLSAFILEKDPKFVSGPVAYEPHTFFEGMQAVEFMGLVTLGAAYLERQVPFLCNGANMAFPRQVFQDLNGYQGVDHQESGDDIWFMHKVFNRYPFEMFFAKHPSLIVKTRGSRSLKSFVNQRKRWTSKNSSYGKLNQLFILAMDYLFYCSLLVNAIGWGVDAMFLKLFLIQLVGKVLIEGVFFIGANRFFKLKGLIMYYLTAIPFQILYVIMIYPLSQFTKFEWKNRRFHA